MRPDMDITQEPANGDLCITLRLDRFLLGTNLLGWTTNTVRAEHIGVEPVTVRRAMAGGAVGERVIVRVVTAMQPYRELLERIGVQPTLDGLFQIGRKAGTR